MSPLVFLLFLADIADHHDCYDWSYSKDNSIRLQVTYICSATVPGETHTCILFHCVRRDTSALSLCQAGYICSVTVSRGMHLFCHCAR